MSVHFSSQRDDWRTPKHILEEIDRVMPIDFDPCPDPTHPSWVSQQHTPLGTDGLSVKWPGSLHTFVNPPYSALKKCEWSKKILETRGFTTALVPSRTDTRWWQMLAQAAEVVFMIKGRLKFGEAVNSAPFPSCLMLFRWQPLDLQSFSTNLGALPLRGL
jgi:hypothetical protein